MNKRILITGINGFAGQYCQELFSRSEYEVFGTVFQKISNDDNNFIQLDLRDASAVKSAIDNIKPDYVLHLASVSFVGHDDKNEIYDTNVGGTNNLLLALSQAEKSPKATLIASSANIYGNSEGGMLDENTPLNPVNDYALSKMEMEESASKYKDILNLIIVRPFNFTGLNQSDKFLIPKIVGHFKRREKAIELGNIEVERDFSDVRDVSAAIKMLIENENAIGGIFNICSGKKKSLRQIIETCTQITGHNLDIRVNPAFVRNNEVKTLVGNPMRLEAMIGQYRQYQISDTIEWMLNS